MVRAINPVSINFYPLAQSYSYNTVPQNIAGFKNDIYIKNQARDIFFDNISNAVFKNSPQVSSNFSYLLKNGYAALSSSCYRSLDNPYSAKALNLEENDYKNNIIKLEKCIQEGVGVGINFNNFQNPTDEIKKINSYFKSRENGVIRPPAGIAILDINHPKIMDFISLKDSENYNDWCFDLSVIINDDFMKRVDSGDIEANKIYSKLLDSMLKKGEPGVIFSSDPDYICDCCNAAQLKPDEGLTLAHINLAKFYNPQTNMCDCNYLKYATDILKNAMNNIDKNAYIGILGYQELLNQMGIRYGSPEALRVLEDCLKVMKLSDIKMAISPTSTTSRSLNVTSGINPSYEVSYLDELNSMAAAQKYLEGGISKTIKLKQNKTINDINFIIRYCLDNKIKGITVF